MPQVPKIETENVLVRRQTFYARVGSFRNILIGLIVSFIILTFFVRQFPYFPFDLVITRAIQTVRLAGFAQLMLAISWLGNEAVGGILTAIFVGIALAARKLRTALMIGVSVTTMTILNQLLKHLVGRPRPDSALVHVVGIFKKSDSFPSGHVMFYVGLYGFLLFIVYTQFKREHWLRRFLISLFSILIVLVGLSRVYLGAHWFSDVLGAYLLGFSWLMVVIWAYKKLNPRVRPN